jgi:hypothetical protein
VGALGGRISRLRAFLRTPRRGAALAIVGLSIATAGALAATHSHFRSGALYTGKDALCDSHVPGTTCVFTFRASKDGLSLRFVGKTVIDSWGCRGGGGEALLGGEARGATPIPRIRVSKNGSLHGSVGYVFRPTSAPPEHYTSTVTGHVSRAGKAAVIAFHVALNSSRYPCSTQPVTITERGSDLGGPH